MVRLLRFRPTFCLILHRHSGRLLCFFRFWLRPVPGGFYGLFMYRKNMTPARSQ